MLMKGKPLTMINREGIQIVTDSKGEADVPEQYVELCKLYGWSPIVLIVEPTPKEEKKEEPLVVNKTSV
jgi:hypothetical protein